MAAWLRKGSSKANLDPPTPAKMTSPDDFDDSPAIRFAKRHPEKDFFAVPFIVNHRDLMAPAFPQDGYTATLRLWNSNPNVRRGFVLLINPAENHSLEPEKGVVEKLYYTDITIRRLGVPTPEELSGLFPMLTVHWYDLEPGSNRSSGDSMPRKITVPVSVSLVTDMIGLSPALLPEPKPEPDVPTTDTIPELNI